MSRSKYQHMRRNPPLRDLKIIGSNMTELDHGNISILYSYNTPVAIFAPSGLYRTSTQHSVTTSKHISKWGALHGLDMKGAKKISQEDLEFAARHGSDPKDANYTRRNPRKRGDPPEESYNMRGGKFYDTVQELLYGIDHDQTVGDVHENGYWYGLVSGLLLPEARDFAEDMGIDAQEFEADAEEYDWPLNAIITENSDGFIEVYPFKLNRDAIKSWHKIERDFG